MLLAVLLAAAGPLEPSAALASPVPTGPSAAFDVLAEQGTSQARDAHAACRGWTDQFRPPPTIRVYRTRGPNAGRVQTVDFRRYVGVVMAGEWPAALHREALRAGAVAVKQYAWYYSVFYRGWLAPDGRCFHVMDSSMDQVYQPELRSAHRRHLEAVEATWPVSLRRPVSGTAGSRFFLTSYRAGRKVACASDADGLKLFQWSAVDCASRGLGMKQILRAYYGSNLQFIDVRQHYILARPQGRGTAAVLAGKAGTGRTEWRLYGATAGGFRSAVRGTIELEVGDLLDQAAGDVTGNGLADLVLLVRSGRKGRQLIVLRASGEGYRRPQLWARWREASAHDGRQLLLADFTGDGLADAGVLKTLPDDRAGHARARLRVLPARPGAFGQMANWWSGGFDPLVNVALAGDVTGDGRADLILRQDRGKKGLRYWVMASLAGGSLRGPRLWLELRDWRAKGTAEVVIDENRDGRDDLIAVRQLSRSRVAVVALRAHAAGRFSVSPRWQTPSAMNMPLADMSPVALHVDNDGRGDLAFFQRASDGTTWLYWLRTTTSGMQLGSVRADDGLHWSRLRSY